MGVFDSTPTTVAFIEAAILGLVVIYLFAEGRPIGVPSVFLAILAVVGLFVLLGVGTVKAPVGDGLVLVSAFVTAFGMLLAEKLNVAAYAPDAEAVVDETQVFRKRVKGSLRKTFVCCLIAGVGTLVSVALANVAFRMPGPPVPMPAPNAWPWIVTLALVGNCVFWFSFFLLIELKQLVLAAAAVAASPVVTELVTQFWFRRPVITTLPQWIAAIVVTGSLGILIALQLGMTPKNSSSE